MLGEAVNLASCTVALCILIAVGLSCSGMHAGTRLSGGEVCIHPWQWNYAPQSKPLQEFIETDGCRLLAEVERKRRVKEREEKQTHHNWTEPEEWGKREEEWAAQEVAAIMDDGRFLILLRIARGGSKLTAAMILAVFMYTYESGEHHTCTGDGWLSTVMVGNGCWMTPHPFHPQCTS